MKLILFAAALAASAVYISRLSRPTESSASEGNTPLERLVEGNARFVSGNLTHFHESIQRRNEVAKGQHPFAVVIGCADSRVPPEVVFDQGLGDLFVVRVAGNVLEDAALGSIEYAVEHLGCELVVVLGHERCGAVDAVLKGGELPGHLAAFKPTIEPVIAAAKTKGGDVLDNAVRGNVRRIVRQLEVCEPILSEYAHLGKMKVIGARYDLDTGLVEFQDAPSTSRADDLRASAHEAASSGTKR